MRSEVDRPQRGLAPNEAAHIEGRNQDRAHQTEGGEHHERHADHACAGADAIANREQDSAQEVDGCKRNRQLGVNETTDDDAEHQDGQLLKEVLVLTLVHLEETPLLVAQIHTVEPVSHVRIASLFDLLAHLLHVLVVELLHVLLRENRAAL